MKAPLQKFAGGPFCNPVTAPTKYYSHTSPEIASVGHTETSAREKGLDVKTAKLPLAGIGRFLAETDGERGLCKVVTGARHGEVLGVHLVGPYAAEIIASAVAIIDSELCVKDVREMVFAHPTVSEVVRETLLLCDA